MFTEDKSSRFLGQEGDYYIIRQPIPWPLAESNSYLIESDDGWTVIDVGVDTPSTRFIWEKALKEIGIKFSQIKQIYITHCHPDHLGAAAWLQQQSQAPVYMLEAEIERARRYIFMDKADFTAQYRQAIVNKTRPVGFPDNLLDELVKDWEYEVTPLFPCPELLLPLHEQDTVELGGLPFEIITAPIHADGQIMLFNQKLNQLFSADVISTGAHLHFTDWPNSDLTSPLAELFILIDKMEKLGEVRVFPGHGPVFNDLPRHLTSLREKQHRRLQRILSLVTEKRTPFELYERFLKIPDIDYVHMDRVMMGELLAYLVYLAEQGEISKYWDEGGVRYGPNQFQSSVRNS